MKTEMSLFATFHLAIPVETIHNETGHLKLKDTSELTEQINLLMQVQSY